MPIPKPRSDEDREAFLQRCMADDVMNSEYDSEQRYAVCLSQWSKKSEVYQMERKIFKFEVKTINEEEGIIEGYGSTFNDDPDSYGDVVDAGAFSKTIQENEDTIVSLFNHDVNQPIGKPVLTQDKKGLFARIKLVRGVQKAEETLLLAKAGVIKRMSIGYDTIKQEMKDGIRHLKEVRLYDVSPVVFAANQNALITDIKAGRVLSASSRNKIQDALDALTALLEAAQEEEPEKSTPDPETLKEAAGINAFLKEIEDAEIVEVLGNIDAELEGFNAREAETRIDKLLAEIN